MLRPRIALLVLTAALALASAPAHAQSESLVISQFQTAGASPADEFVEIRNVSDETVSLTGLRLVYRSAAGTTDVSLIAFPAGFELYAHRYLLVVGPGYDGSTSGDWAYNSGSTGSLAAAGGGLAIRDGAPNTGTIIDSVGYGSATNAFVETAATSAAPANSSKSRIDDTNDNSADFQTTTPSAPRNFTTQVAGTVRVAGAVMSFEAAEGADNDVWIDDSGNGTLTISDVELLEIEPGSPCTAADDFTVTCDAVNAVEAQLGDGDDLLEVTAGVPAVAMGGPGADDLTTGGGDDTLDGGTGRDILDGGEGVDTISYAERGDRVAVTLDGLANDGADPDGNGYSNQAEEKDQDIGIENVVTGAGGDRVLGSAGNNVLDGGLGRDRLDGGDGQDTISYADRTGPVAVRLDGLANDGADPNGSSFSAADEENDRDLNIEDVVTGSGNDRIYGNAGANTLDGGLGKDVLDGGDGIDTLTYAGRSTPVAVRLDGLANDGDDPNSSGTSAAGEENDRDLNIETAIGGSAADQLRAQRPDVLETLFGGDGDDLLVTVDGQEDDAYCGGGFDVHYRDAGDLSDACENN